MTNQLHEKCYGKKTRNGFQLCENTTLREEYKHTLPIFKHLIGHW